MHSLYGGMCVLRNKCWKHIGVLHATSSEYTEAMGYSFNYACCTSVGEIEHKFVKSYFFYYVHINTIHHMYTISYRTKYVHA